MTTEQKGRLRRQMAEQAVKLAVSNRWEEAAATNRELLRLIGDDIDALNRLGKALSELGRMEEARESYRRALELEPANTIARRNLDRLSSMEDESDQPASQLDTSIFVEETGKAGVGALQAVDSKEARKLDAGDLVELEVAGKAVNVHSKAGAYIGMLEPRIGLRLSRLIASGNKYSAAVLTVAGDEIRVVLRETFQHPSQASTVSFPQGRRSEVRGYTRRTLIQEEVEYLDTDAEDTEDEAPDGWTTTDAATEADRQAAGIKMEEDDPD